MDNDLIYLNMGRMVIYSLSANQEPLPYYKDNVMTKIKEDNFIIIQGWMIKDLDLKGNKLLIYAIVYGFSQGLENQKFTGSLQYLADWTNSTKQGVMVCLNALVKDGLLFKEERVVNKVKYCSYWSTKFRGGMKESCIGGIQQSLPNNIDIYNIEYNKKETNVSTKKDSDFEEFWSLYPKQRIGSKKKALTSYLLALKEKRSTRSELLEAVKIYANSKEVENGYAKGCSAWLNDDRFNNEYELTDENKKDDAFAKQLDGIL